MFYIDFEFVIFIRLFVRENFGKNNCFKYLGKIIVSVCISSNKEKKF